MSEKAVLEKAVFRKLECVCVQTADVDASLKFYLRLGLTESWRIRRALDHGGAWTLVGLRFPDPQSSELVLSDHPDRRGTEVEILVDDVNAAFAALSADASVNWIEPPFATESGHVAVMQAPDGNIFVLVGG